MNKVYKVVWSKAKNAYVVVSELAKNSAKGCSSKKLLAMVVAAGIMMGGAGVASAGEVLSNKTGNKAEGTNAVVAGGAINNASGQLSGVVAGQNNTVTEAGHASVIVGGGTNINDTNDPNANFGNKIGTRNSIIGAGMDNEISVRSSIENPTGADGASAAIVAGSENTVTGRNGGILVGNNNTVNGGNAAVVGGRKNTVDGNDSTIAGGRSNTITGKNSFIGAGGSFVDRSVDPSTEDFSLGNTVSGDFSAVVVGQKNVSEGKASLVGAGFNNNVVGSYSGVVTGVNNSIGGHVGSDGKTVDNANSIIGAGDTNKIEESKNAGILTGSQNTITGSPDAVIVGGHRNTIANTEDYYRDPNTQELVLHTNSSGILAGDQNTIEAKNSVIVGGYINTVKGNNAIIGAGRDNTVNGDASGVLAGRNNTVNGRYSAVVAGLNNQANGAGSVVAGGGTDVRSSDNLDPKDANIANARNSFIGGGAKNLTVDGAHNAVIAGGYSNTVKGIDSGVFVGHDNTASGGNSAVLSGKNNNATKDNSVVLGGSNNNATGELSSVLGGENNTAEGKNSTAFGSGSNAKGENSLAGLGGTAEGKNTIALGEGAIATPEGAVALGSGAEATRDAAATAGKGVKNDYYTGNQTLKDAEKAEVNVGNRVIGGVAAGVEDTDAVNVGQWKTTAMGLEGDSGTGNVNLFEQRLNVKGDNNITTEASGNTVTVKLNKNIDLGSDGSVTMGDTVVNNDGMTVKNGPTITKNNVDMNNQQIHNVAAGTAPNDAVNVSQLKEVTQSVSNIDNKVNKLDSRINKVGAGAAALAALHPMDFDPDDKLQFSAGFGNYNGQNAGAIGMFYRPDEKVMFSVGGTVGNGENMVNAGVTFSLDRTARVTNTKTAMAKQILDLQDQMAKVMEVNAQLVEQVNKMGAMLNTTTGTSFRQVDASSILFPDVPENHWAYNYVYGLVERGIIEGYPNGMFNGERSMTRYEFSAMLYRALLAGDQLNDELLKEFGAEIEKLRQDARFRVDRVHGEDNDKRKVERVRTNGDEKDAQGNVTQYRDHYGSKIMPVTAK